MPGALGRDHDDIEVGARLDLLEVDVEAVGERKRGALLDIGLYHVVIDLRVVLVRQQDHDDIRALHRVLDRLHRETGFLRLGPRGAVLAQPDGDLHAGFLQVVGVGMALGAVADDGHMLALDEGQVGVFVVVDLHGFPCVVRKTRNEMRTGR